MTEGTSQTTIYETVHVYIKLKAEGVPCPFCEKAVAWLADRGIPFSTEELGPVGRQLLYDRLELEGSQRTVPQVMVTDVTGEEHRIGGYQELITSGLETLFGERSVAGISGAP